MKMSEIKVDPKKIEEGTLIGDIPEFEGVRLRVRGMWCKEHKKLQAHLAEAIPRSRRPRNKISQDDQERILGRCLHEVILLDWEGLQNDDGTPLPYDKATALTYLTDPAYRKFREAVVWAADIVSTEKAEDLEADLGNSEPSSPGI